MAGKKQYYMTGIKDNQYDNLWSWYGTFEDAKGQCLDLYESGIISQDVDHLAITNEELYILSIYDGNKWIDTPSDIIGEENV